MNNLKIVFILAKPYIIQTITSYCLFIVLFSGILISTFPVSWNGENLTFFQIPLEVYGGSREQALISILHEFFSWSWIFLAFYVLFKLLLPLGDSFLVSQLLWLRLTPCLPWQVATARVLWVISYAFLCGFLGCIWVLITVYFHQVSPIYPLLDVFGFICHVIFSAGIITCLDWGLQFDYFLKRIIAFIALIIPILLQLIYLIIEQILDPKYTKFFPYAVPFASPSKENFYHFGILGLIGVLLLVIHIASKAKYSSVQNVVSSLESK